MIDLANAECSFYPGELRDTLATIQNPRASSGVIATFRYPTRVRDYFLSFDDDDDNDDDDR